MTNGTPEQCQLCPESRPPFPTRNEMILHYTDYHDISKDEIADRMGYALQSVGSKITQARNSRAKTVGAQIMEAQTRPNICHHCGGVDMHYEDCRFPNKPVMPAESAEAYITSLRHQLRNAWTKLGCRCAFNDLHEKIIEDSHCPYHGWQQRDPDGWDPIGELKAERDYWKADRKGEFPQWIQAEWAKLSEAQAVIKSLMRPDYPFRCDDCGGAHFMDCVIPSPIWNAICRNGTNDAEMLCALCIDKRLQAAGLKAEAEFYYGGEALVSRLYTSFTEEELDMLRGAVITASSEGILGRIASDYWGNGGSDETLESLLAALGMEQAQTDSGVRLLKQP